MQMNLMGAAGFSPSPPTYNNEPEKDSKAQKESNMKIPATSQLRSLLEFAKRCVAAAASPAPILSTYESIGLLCLESLLLRQALITTSRAKKSEAFATGSDFRGACSGTNERMGRPMTLPNWLRKFGATGAMALAACAPAVAHGESFVSEGKFTIVYVYVPDSPGESWDTHMARRRPDGAQFSRAAIDKFVADLMAPVWPSYFDALYQYGCHRPEFFGSSIAKARCVQSAIRENRGGVGGVMARSTVRTLSNCHDDGMDPSPQEILIFGPEFHIVDTPLPFNAWHDSGLNTPNHAAMPLDTNSEPTFQNFTQTLSHEIVEMLSNPAGTGHGGPAGTAELGDKCGNRADATTQWNGYSVARYWSDFDNNCLPRLDPPAGSTNITWVWSRPGRLFRFTGDQHKLPLLVAPTFPTSDAAFTQALLVVQTGGDNLRGGHDNANALLEYVGGVRTNVNINQGREWRNGETHALLFKFPPPIPRVRDITNVTITTHFGGGISGDNWDVDRVALLMAVPSGSVIHPPPQPVVHEWLSASEAPLVRFTSSTSEHAETVSVPSADQAKEIASLDVIISTGNDDLRGGSRPGDNCDVSIELVGGTKTIRNVNGGHPWRGWTKHTVTFSSTVLGGRVTGRDVKAVKLHTGFSGGLSGDNGNVNWIQLEATLK